MSKDGDSLVSLWPFIHWDFFSHVSNQDFPHVRCCSVISSDRARSIPRAITQCNGEVTASTCLLPPVTAARWARCLFATREHCWWQFLAWCPPGHLHLILQSCFPAHWHQILTWRNTGGISEGWMFQVVKKICPCFISRWTPDCQEAQLWAWIQTSRLSRYVAMVLWYLKYYIQVRRMKQEEWGDPRLSANPQEKKKKKSELIHISQNKYK